MNNVISDLNVTLAWCCFLQANRIICDKEDIVGVALFQKLNFLLSSQSQKYFYIIRTSFSNIKREISNNRNDCMSCTDTVEQKPVDIYPSFVRQSSVCLS